MISGCRYRSWYSNGGPHALDDLQEMICPTQSETEAFHANHVERTFQKKPVFDGAYYY